jgi:hypothetical protein
MHDADKTTIGSSTTKVKGKSKLPKIPTKLLVQIVA